MKINFVMWGTDKCGGSRHLFILANFLAEKGHEVSVISLGYPSHEWFPFHKSIKFIYPEQRNCIPLPKKGRRSFADICNKFLDISKSDYYINKMRFLARAIPDADVSIATYYPTAYSVFMANKGKLCYYVQHYEPLFPKDKFESRFAEASYYLPLKKFAVSHWLIRDIEKITGHKMIYTGAGVDLDIFKPSKTKEEKTILGLFRKAEWKGGPDMIKTFKLVHEKMPEVKFKIIGIKEDIEKEIALHGADFDYEVCYGKRGNMLNDSEISKLFSTSTIFLFTSHLEGFGSPPLEAMACGTPCVTTSCGGVLDFAKHNYNSFVVPIKNPRKAADAVIFLLKNKKTYEKFRRNGLKIVKDFTWDKMASRLEKGIKNENSKI